MKVAIATVQVPFIQGGAELLAENLAIACREAGYKSEIITMPFRFYPDREVLRSMDIWESENFDEINEYNPDLVICLKFPTYYLQHHDKRLWLLHQHRTVYDLWPADPNIKNDLDYALKLRNEIIRRDNLYISNIKHRHTISQNVADRLRRYNGIEAEVIYHPPHGVEDFYTEAALPYIFFPSRLESLKRQYLLIEAMRYVRSSVAALIAGTGGQMTAYTKLIEQYQLTSRVRLIGAISREELVAFYARCLAVFFGPYDEDYGYVALEGMLAAKPIITCTDSGGPLEFVRHGDTGLVVPPDPESIAAAIDDLFVNKDLAASMGRKGREYYFSKGISWNNVVTVLLQR